MKKKAKYFLFILVCFELLSCESTLDKSRDKIDDFKFSLEISTYNHAREMSDGTMKYVLVDSVLTINRIYFLSELEETLLTKTINYQSIYNFRSINLDSLENHYINPCVLPTSGDRYTITVVNDTTVKSIHLHSYYIKQIDELINELNKQIPDSLKIRYMTSDTKQDCW